MPSAVVRNIPDKLTRLFVITKKSQVESYANSLNIEQGEFVRLVCYCEQIGYEHFHAHKEFQPDEAQLSEDDINVFRRDDAKELKLKLLKIKRKLTNLYDVRKYTSAHLFQSDEKWHLFYFTLRDVESGKNQWQLGSHIHFVNYLWPHYRVEELQELLFASRRIQIADSLHIRYLDSKFD
jgi:hypothetical protein